MQQSNYNSKWPPSIEHELFKSFSCKILWKWELCLTWFRQWIADKNKITSSLLFRQFWKIFFFSLVSFPHKMSSFSKQANRYTHTFLALFCEVEKKPENGWNLLKHLNHGWAVPTNFFWNLNRCKLDAKEGSKSSS